MAILFLIQQIVNSQDVTKTDEPGYKHAVVVVSHDLKHQIKRNLKQAKSNPDISRYQDTQDAPVYAYN